LAPVHWLIVHSPLVGPRSCRPLATLLGARGHDVAVADLVAATQAGPPFWPAQVVAAVGALDGSEHPAVVTGHSGAGPLLPAIGAALGSRVCGYVFVDAGLPAPGRSRLQTLPPELARELRDRVDRDRLPPWVSWWGESAMAELVPDVGLRTALAVDGPPLPWPLFTEPLPYVPDWPDAACGYLRLSGAYAAEADQARTAGWPVIERDGGHLDVAVRPAAVASDLEELARRMGL
jgi:hypothetical protein